MNKGTFGTSNYIIEGNGRVLKFYLFIIATYIKNNNNKQSSKQLHKQKKTFDLKKLFEIFKH